MLPNVLTLLRIALLPPLAWLILSARYPSALILAALAGLSDLADGYLAKRFGWVSRFGSIADPTADKLLMVVAYTSLAAAGLLPWWLLALTVSRDLVIVTGAYAYHRLVEPLIATPLWSGKLNTALQTLLIAVVLLDAGLVPLPAAVTVNLTWLVAVSTLSSMLHYVVIWARRAHERWPR